MENIVMPVYSRNLKQGKNIYQFCKNVKDEAELENKKIWLNLDENTNTSGRHISHVEVECLNRHCTTAKPLLQHEALGCRQNLIMIGI